jgi:hypothetical protein
LGITEEKNVKEQKGVQRMKKEKRHMHRSISKWLLSGTIAAIIILGVFTRTNTGQALINDIKKYFEPEKKITQEIEGMSEEKEMALQEGEAGYVIYIDEERYTFVKEREQDIIIPKTPLEERYPEVSMTISQVVDKEPEELASQIHQELKKTFKEVKDVTTVKEPVKGLLVAAIDGNEWDSLVTQVYIISNSKKGSFVIQEKYFLEAAEGHGSRFYHMLKEFEVVENKD